MDFLEQDLEDIIYNAPRESLEDRGLYVEGIMKRQLRIGNYGTADLVTFIKYPKGVDSCRIKITVYELKKGKIGVNAFMQGIRYIKGIQTYLDRYEHLCFPHYELVLIGDSFDKDSSFIYLTDIMSGESFDFTICTYKYDYDGIKFTNHWGYKLTDNGFNNE